MGHHPQRSLCHSKPSLTSAIRVIPSALSIHLFTPHSLPHSCTHLLPPSAFAGSSNSALLFLNTDATACAGRLGQGTRGSTESSGAQVVREGMSGGSGPVAPCQPSPGRAEPRWQLRGNLWAFPVLSSLEVILLGDLRGRRGAGGPERPAQHHVPMEGRGSVTLPAHARVCMHTHTSSRAEARTGPWTPQTFTRT